MHNTEPDVQTTQEEVVEPKLVTDGRKLVTIRKIDKLTPIEGADVIEVATIDGWEVITKKGEFAVNEYCVFFEIDSFLPADEPKFEFLASRGSKVDEFGKERLRIRTMKMRGVVSQGLALPIRLFKKELSHIVQDEEGNILPDVDAAIHHLEKTRSGIEEYFNVIKYVKPSERESNSTPRAKTAGDFPIVIPKTDEDRVQNVYNRYATTARGVMFRESLKLDGSSETIAYISEPDYFLDKLDTVIREFNEETGEMDVVETIPYPFQYDEAQVIVCSRNQVLKFDEANHFWKAVLSIDLPTRLRQYCLEYDRSLAIQGECMGPAIQGNREELKHHQFFAFRIWDITNREFLDDMDFIEVCNALDLQTVPQGEVIDFFAEYPTLKEALEAAQRPSMHHTIAEGFVYKSVEKVDGKTIHFKVINNQYLLKEK